MSLFKAREFWSVKLDADEEFGDGAIAAGNVDNSPFGISKLVCGTLLGKLRIYDPGLTCHSLLLETQLDSPILQVEIGRLIAVDNNYWYGLVVLHPNKLVVFSVEAHMTASAAEAGQASHHELLPHYIHRLDKGAVPFSAHSICLGDFGDARDHDLILVQSMDGRIRIFEHNAEVLTRKLQDCLLPGPLSYVPSTDAFVLCTSSMFIKCFKYQVLAASADTVPITGTYAELDSEVNPIEDADDVGTSGITSRRLALPYWCFNIGEPISTLVVAHVSTDAPCDLLALGERTLFVLSVSGTLKATKMLDFEPSVLCVYPRTKMCSKANEDGGKKQLPVDSGARAQDGIIIGSTDSRLFIFSDPLTIIWAARGAHSDIHKVVAITHFNVTSTQEGAPGMLAVLDESCRLTLQYEVSVTKNWRKLSILM